MTFQEAFDVIQKLKATKALIKLKLNQEAIENIDKIIEEIKTFQCEEE